MSSERILVGELRESLSKFPPETEITFGSSAFRKRPIIYYRCKNYGPNVVLIEFNEIEDISPDELPEHWAEIDSRITVKKLLKDLSPWEDTAEVEFGCSIDAVPFELRDITPVVGFNLKQTHDPDPTYLHS